MNKWCLYLYRDNEFIFSIFYVMRETRDTEEKEINKFFHLILKNFCFYRKNRFEIKGNSIKIDAQILRLCNRLKTKRTKAPFAGAKWTGFQSTNSHRTN